MKIMVQAVFPVISDVDVFPTIIVVVPDTNALSPACRSEAGFLGYIRERTVMIVVIEVIGRRLFGGKLLSVVPFTKKTSGQPSLS